MLTVITNHHHRPVLNGWELTPAERAEFDYIDWAAVEDGRDSAEFIRYKGDLIDLHDIDGRPPEALAGWDGYRSDSFFSGVVFKYADDYESVIVGRYYS